jgi:hypothetical protein
MTRTELEIALSGKMHRSFIEELMEWTIQSKRNFKVIMDCFTMAENKIDQRARIEKSFSENVEEN